MEKFNKADSFEASWRENGFIVIKDLFPHSALTAFRGEIAALFAARFGCDTGDIDAGLDTVRTGYARDRQKWQECAKRLWNLPALAHLAGLPEVHGLVRKLGLRMPIYSTPPEVRIDMPNDQQYMQPWHQDWRYGQGSLNSVTMWTPLHDVARIQGALEIVGGTHVLGYLEVEELSDPRRFSIVDKRFSGEGGEVVEVAFGDTVIFSQFLAHRSGANISGAPRISFQLRFSDLLDKAYLEQGYGTPQSSSIIWSKLPSANDLRSLFN